MSDRLKWGVLGPGAIADWFARGLVESETGTLHAVGSRSLDRANGFADRFHARRRHGSYEALLADPEVEAVYIATPHPMHREWVVRAAEAGKHILVEKPIGINEREAQEMIDAAREHDVFLMEAFMYRCHPLAHRLRELIRGGAVGEVRLIQSSFAFHSHAGPDNRAFAPELAGGGILDVGCYPASISRLIAGAAAGKDFADPVEVKACGHRGATGVDEWTAAVVQFPGDIIGELSCGVRLNTMQAPMLRVFGTDGMLQIADPWQPSRFDRQPSCILVTRQGTPDEILVDAPAMLYAYEADSVARHLAQRQSPEMSWDDTLGNIRLLDRWRQEVGVTYEADR